MHCFVGESNTIKHFLSRRWAKFADVVNKEWQLCSYDKTNWRGQRNLQKQHVSAHSAIKLTEPKR